MAELNDKITNGVLGLGHVVPNPDAADRDAGLSEEPDRNAGSYEEKDDANRRAGSRDVDEGGGVATEVAGTRNYHSTGGATGGDLGNRPE